MDLQKRLKPVYAVVNGSTKLVWNEGATLLPSFRGYIVSGYHESEDDDGEVNINGRISVYDEWEDYLYKNMYAKLVVRAISADGRWMLTSAITTDTYDDIFDHPDVDSLSSHWQWTKFENGTMTTINSINPSEYMDGTVRYDINHDKFINSDGRYVCTCYGKNIIIFKRGSDDKLEYYKTHTINRSLNTDGGILVSDDFKLILTTCYGYCTILIGDPVNGYTEVVELEKNMSIIGAGTTIDPERISIDREKGEYAVLENNVYYISGNSATLIGNLKTLIGSTSSNKYFGTSPYLCFNEHRTVMYVSDENSILSFAINGASITYLGKYDTGWNRFIGQGTDRGGLYWDEDHGNHGLLTSKPSDDSYAYRLGLYGMSKNSNEMITGTTLMKSEITIDTDYLFGAAIRFTDKDAL